MSLEAMVVETIIIIRRDMLESSKKTQMSV